tara:strand:- start:104 stop:505 length:402 start_codon:yes stop_codon:yes gene_type:complete
MTKLHHTEYKKNYKKYILSTIETDNNNKPLNTDQEKIKYIFDRFYSEYYCHSMPLRCSRQKAMSEWLSGLALDIECWYDDIVKLAVKMGSINPNPSDRLRNKVEQGYYDFMANIILGFEPKEKIKAIHEMKVA